LALTVPESPLQLSAELAALGSHSSALTEQVSAQSLVSFLSILHPATSVILHFKIKTNNNNNHHKNNKTCAADTQAAHASTVHILHWTAQECLGSSHEEHDSTARRVSFV
jgi:hypothetical protein